MREEPPSSGDARRFPWLRTVRARLVLLIAICFLPLGIAELYFGRREWVHARDAELLANLEIAQAVALAFESFVHEVAQHELTLGLALDALAPDSPAAGEILDAAGRAYGSVRGFVWVDARGTVTAASAAADVGVDVSGETYFAALAAGTDVVVSDLLRWRALGEPVFVVARARRGGDGVLRAAIVVVVDPATLVERRFPLKRRDGGAYALLDRAGRVVLRSPPLPAPGGDPMLHVRRDALFTRAAAGADAVGEYVSPTDGARRLGASAPLRGIGWVARASRPREVALRPVVRELQLQSAIALGLALGALLLAAGVSRGITGPLRRLRASIGLLSRAGLPRVEPGGPVKIRALADAYNAMAERLVARDAELAAASAQREEGLSRAESAAEEARRERERLDAVFGAIGDGLVIYDAEGRVVAMNAPAERLFGPQAEARPLGHAERLARLRVTDADGREISLAETPLSRALAGERIQGCVLGIERRDRPGAPVQWVSASASPVEDERGARVGVVSVFTDITALRDLQEQRDDLLRTVSHDLRTPLNVIATHGHLLLGDAGDPAAVRRRAEGIAASVRRMSTLIKDIIDLARFDSGQLRLERQPVFPATFVHDALEDVLGALPTERVRVRAHPDLPMILADPDRLERVLLNLVSNALKYSSPRTEVTVELRPEEGGVEIAVADRGPGIAPEDLPRLFTRYGRGASAVAGGTGLGLFITRTLVEAHGGRVSAESRPGEGSTFRVWLPVTPAEPRGPG